MKDGPQTAAKNSQLSAPRFRQQGNDSCSSAVPDGATHRHVDVVEIKNNTVGVILRGFEGGNDHKERGNMGWIGRLK